MISPDGVDCLFKFSETGLKMEGYAKVDNFHIPRNNNHNILDLEKLNANKTMARLVRKAQSYKRECMHEITRKKKSVD